MAASLVRCTLRLRGCQILGFLRPSLVSSSVECRRGVKRYLQAYLKELYRKRLEAGPEKLRHRSEWINWNYDAEIYAFGKRLGEEFSAASLKTAFTHRSYIEKEEKHRADLGIDKASAPLGLNDNTELAQTGEKITSCYIKAYLRSLYPAMFEEVVIAIHNHLMSETTLSFVASHIGIGDLMLCADFPPLEATLKKSFLAVVGALSKDQGVRQAESLVRDLVLAQLNGKDFSEVWSLPNPMGVLSVLLQAQGMGAPEPRLQWQAGARTAMAMFQVGIYSDKRLIGQAAGETVAIAEEMAAQDCLQHFMGVTESRTPLKFQADGDHMKLDYDKENLRVDDILKQVKGSDRQLSST